MSSTHKTDYDPEVDSLVEEFLEHDLLQESVSEEVSRHHDAGNHDKALRLILDTRRDRQS